MNIFMWHYLFKLKNSCHSSHIHCWPDNSKGWNQIYNFSTTFRITKQKRLLLKTLFSKVYSRQGFVKWEELCLFLWLSWLAVELLSPLCVADCTSQYLKQNTFRFTNPWLKHSYGGSNCKIVFYAKLDNRFIYSLDKFLISQYTFK